MASACAEWGDGPGQASAVGRAVGLGWSRRWVTAALLAGIPIMASFCLTAQWPMWRPGDIGLAAANLFVTLSFYATSVFVAAEPQQRLTGLGLAAAAFLWPVNWVNEWHVGPLPVLAALEGPLASLLAVWALLRYPSPWPRRRYDVITLVIVVLVEGTACLPVLTSLPQWHGLPQGTPWLAWWPDERAYVLAQGIYNYGIIVVAVAAVLALTIRLDRLRGPDRRVMRPVMVAVGVAGTLTAAGGLAAALGMSTRTVDTLYTLEGIALIGVPLTFLIAAARRWLARERIPRLIRALDSCANPKDVQHALRDALTDPSLRLLYQVGDDYVDTDGEPQPGLPGTDPQVAVVAVESTEVHVVLLIADSVLARYRDTVHAAARAATLAMENTSLQATIRAQIHRVAESAGRLAAARDAERRSIQGAVASICAHELTPLAAGLGKQTDDGSGTGLSALLDDAQELVSRAQLDLARLGEGLGPAELTQLGLAEMVTAAAQRLNPRIEVAVSNDPLPAGLQTTAYFVLCELMTNAVKYAPAAETKVRAEISGTELVLEVTDDGPGGADPAGSGLQGVAERAEGRSGSLTIRSAPGCGTRALVRLPV